MFYPFIHIESHHVIAASLVSDGSEPAQEVEEDKPIQAPTTGSQPAAPAPAATLISLETGDHKPGDVAVVETSNWNETAKILISGVEVEILEVADKLVSFQVPDLEPGTYPWEVKSDLATITVLVDFVVTESIASTAGEFKAWTQRISDDQVKVYVKNPINQGKVQVLVDGKEIAWLRAENENDPKLRQADGSYYLVRTVGLTPTKQAIEVLLDGNRVWRAVYPDKG